MGWPSKKQLIIVLLFLSPSLPAFASTQFNDVSGLNPMPVYDIVAVKDVSDIQAALQLAESKKLKVSISGKRHSQGGQQSCANCLVLDMLSFNQILSLDEQNKVIRVQPGATWEDIQRFAKPRGLSVEVMQASNIFTVGGSLGPNIHGNDPNYGTIIETVKSFHLVQPDGSLINVSREENAELFSLVIGGYGLFGVIADVDLQLTDDAPYAMTSSVMDYKAYPEFFKKKILGNQSIGLHSAKLSNAPSSLLREVIETTYTTVDQKFNSNLFELVQEKDIGRNRFFMGLSRHFGWGKDLRWFLQKYLVANVGKTKFISRNNAMRPIIKFLDYHSSKNTDILQEYFVPMDNFVDFVDGLRNIVKKDHVNLLSITIRYVPKDKESFMPYAKDDMFALVLYINQGLSPQDIDRARQWTQHVVDLTLQLDGTYYLPYQQYPTKDQLLEAYPEFEKFIQRKNQHDPYGIFMNQFYQHYTQ